MASEWSDRNQILHELAGLLTGVRSAHPLRVAIDGTSAAGKTMLAEELSELLSTSPRPALRVSVDEFLNASEVRYRRGRLSPEGYYHDSVDYEALASLVLTSLGPGRSKRYRTGIRDRHSDKLLKRPLLIAKTDAIVLIDGVFLLRPELEGFWDLRIFVYVDVDEARKRWLARDGVWMGEFEAIQRYEKRYLPAEWLYLDSIRPETKADIVLNNTDLAHPVLRLRRDFG